MAFKKGISGNPKGKSKLVLDLIAEAQKHGAEALEHIVSLMKFSEDEKIVLDCAKYLLDRGFGKPSQAVEIGPKDGAPFRLIIEGVTADDR